MSPSRKSVPPSGQVLISCCGNSEWDPAYTDNDALCPACRCLVDQHAVCDGSVITHEHLVAEEGASQTPSDPLTGELRMGKWYEKTKYWTRSVFTELDVTDDWDRLKTSVFHKTCPVCQKLSLDGFLNKNPTLKRLIIVRRLRLSPPGLPKHCGVYLQVQYDQGDMHDPRRQTMRKFALMTEKCRLTSPTPIRFNV